MPSKAVTVTATYKLSECTITFNSCGGNGTKAPVQVSYGNNYTLPENPFTAPEGKEFDGWSLSQNGEKITGTINVTEDIALFARWKNIEVEPETETEVKTDPEQKAENKQVNIGLVIAIVIIVMLVAEVEIFAIIWFLIKKKTFKDLLNIFIK